MSSAFSDFSEATHGGSIFDTSSDTSFDTSSMADWQTRFLLGKGRLWVLLFLVKKQETSLKEVWYNNDVADEDGGDCNDDKDWW